MVIWRITSEDFKTVQYIRQMQINKVNYLCDLMQIVRCTDYQHNAYYPKEV